MMVGYKEENMKNGKTRKLKSGIEIIKDIDEQGNKRYTAIDPIGYIGRTRIAECDSYYDVLRCIREYVKNNGAYKKNR